MLTREQSNNATIEGYTANTTTSVAVSTVDEPLDSTRREQSVSASNITITANEFDDFDGIVLPPASVPQSADQFPHGSRNAPGKFPKERGNAGIVPGNNDQSTEQQQKAKWKIIIASIVSLLLAAILGFGLYYSGAIEAFAKWLSPIAESEFQGPTMFQGPIYVETDEEEVEVDPHYVENVNGYISMIDVNGNLMFYSDSYLTSSPPRSGAGLWYGSASTTDGTWGYFIGHNPGDFNCVLDLVEGDEIIVYDDDGNAYRYFVVLTFDVARYSTWGDVRDRVTGYGESVILQTCIDHTSGYRIVVAQ